MPIEIRSIDSMDVKIDDMDYLKLSPWCFGACLTEKEKSLIKDQIVVQNSPMSKWNTEQEDEKLTNYDKN